MESLLLNCIVKGDSVAFPVKIQRTNTVGELKEAINTSLKLNTPSKDLTLWHITDGATKTELRDALLNEFDDELEDLQAHFSSVTRTNRIYIVVQPPQQGFFSKENIGSTEFVPEIRTAFAHLKDDLRVGDPIIMPSMGQIPNAFELHRQGHKLFVTEQMLQLWEDMRGDQERTYRRVLSGPMGVGKSYLSYFLVASAYAEGWPVLYISDAGLLDEDDENVSALQIVKRFLAINKDILTGAELEMLVSDYDGTRDISRNALSMIFRSLLQSRDRKALLLVDEHGALFKEKPYLPEKFPSLKPLNEYGWWGEDAKGSRVIFSGTAHAKYEMTLLKENYRKRSVVFVGPLSSIVFSTLLETYPLRDAPDDIRKEVTQITNCVPGELVRLATWAQNSFSEENLQKWTESRTNGFLWTATLYYNSLVDSWSKGWFYEALVSTLLDSPRRVDFGWDFMDLGLLYRSKGTADRPGIQNHILCRPAQRALLELLRTLPLPEQTKNRISDGRLSGHDFESALFHQLVCTPKPILLNATDLNGKNSTLIELDFIHYETLQIGQISLGRGREKVLTGGDKDSRRFNYMLGPLFIQMSLSDFGEHEKSGSGIRDAFTKIAQEPNEIENYLDDLYGPSHSATIENNRFVVKKNNVAVDGFHIVYIRGSSGQPTHCELVKRFPDLLHVTYEEVKEKLFKGIVGRQ
ncbi:hypothetical protein BGZ83_003305 [Gryganskiella cystojenkinii]|nr:hypothetical protein BGZ83_003305 [Gryganskiella cystojenkinii]